MELYIAVGISRYVWLLRDGLKSPKHVEHLMINKDTLYESVHIVGLLIYNIVPFSLFLKICYSTSPRINGTDMHILNDISLFLQRQHYPFSVPT